MNYKDIQKEESKTWLLEDQATFEDKRQREVIRYPLIKKQMGLDHLDTTNMVVYDIGAGPFGGVSSVLRAKEIYRFDPLKDDYGKIADVSSYVDLQAEEIDYSGADLVISTNAIDHFEDPCLFFETLVSTMKPGAYFGHFHAINNAITHPHKAHVYNINPEMTRKYLYKDFELCWEMNYNSDGLTYAWRKQPAFAQLWRKVTGYGR